MIALWTAPQGGAWTRLPGPVMAWSILRTDRLGKDSFRVELADAALPDGVYTAEFDTDSGMFHANEACNGMGTLTVENGQMTFHVSLQSQKIVNLYPGLAADAPALESDWLQPTVDTVTYSDGTSDEVYGFDIPVAAVDADFQLAILGT